MSDQGITDIMCVMCTYSWSNMRAYKCYDTVWLIMTYKRYHKISSAVMDLFHCLFWLRINQTFWSSASMPNLYIRSPGFRSHPTDSGCPYWSVCSFSPNSSCCCFIAGIELLQDIPLDTAITETTDHGKPIVIALPNSSQVKKINTLPTRWFFN